VVVVGAGHNGLVCAAHLARAGFAVTVLEQAEQSGGAVSSHADTLPGFVHDRCAGFFPLTLASPAFEGLEVRERLAWANPDVAMAYPFADGTAIALHATWMRPSPAWTPWRRGRVAGGRRSWSRCWRGRVP
jgi:phytoene dehydrogenase-like protein